MLIRLFPHHPRGKSFGALSFFKGSISFNKVQEGSIRFNKVEEGSIRLKKFEEG